MTDKIKQENRYDTGNTWKSNMEINITCQSLQTWKTTLHVNLFKHGNQRYMSISSVQVLNTIFGLK